MINISVWFDSAKAPNQWTQGATPVLNSDGAIPPDDWYAQCKVKSRAPIAPGPQEALNQDALETARNHAAFDYCIAQTKDVADQFVGTDVDISTGEYMAFGGYY